MAGSKAKIPTKATRLRALYRRRKVLLASAKAIQGFETDYTVDQVNEVNVRIQHLDAIFSEYDQIETEVEELEDVDGVSDERLAFQTSYYALKSALTAKLPAVTPPRTQPLPRTVQSNVNPVQNVINLPQIKIEPFAGRLEDWSSFHDLYHSLIHANNNLSQIQKFYYLKSVLREEALRVINTVELTAENYNVAWTLLLERYNKRPLLVKRHIAALFSINPVKKESAQALLELADEHEKHISILNKLQPAAQHWNSVMIESISRRMDPNTLKAWETSLTEGEAVEFTQAIEFLRKRAYILESVSLCQAQQGAKPQQQQQQSHQKRVTAQVATEGNMNKCNHCNMIHLLSQCEKFKQLTSQARLELAKDYKVCLNCLKTKHFARNCKSSSCQRCGGRHHTLLHIEWNTRDGSTSHQPGTGNRSVQNSGDGSSSHQPGMRDRPVQYSGDGSSSQQSGTRNKPVQYNGGGSSSHQSEDRNGGSAKECAPGAHSQVTLSSIVVPSGVSSPSENCKSKKSSSLTISVPSSNSSSSGNLDLPGNSSWKAESPSGKWKASAIKMPPSVDHQLGATASQSASSSRNTSHCATSTQSDIIEKEMLALPNTKEQKPSVVLLSTAIVKVFDAEGNVHLARALLDSGSQPNFISERLSQKLRLKRTRIYTPVSGIGQSTATVRYSQYVRLQSRLGDYTTILECLILNKLTISLPSCHLDVSKWKIPCKQLLADPQFNISQAIDLILGAEIFYELLLQDQVILGRNLPIMQNTVFGYIISGKVTDSASVENTQTTLLCIEPNLDEILQRFWDSEERYEERTLTQEEEECERHFVQTHERDEDGRYLVRLPLKTELLPLLGDAHLAAIRRLRSTERRFSNNTKLQTEYVKFMDEYEQLGHMQECKGRFDNPQFVLPHHAVLREESTTTKTRVVFDGSCRGSTQLSLNDVLYTGATVQPALYDTLINFRIPRYAVTADVEKMFRQIWVHPEDRKYQQICWRKDTSSPVKMFTLNTVTYGLSSSPFHAARVLNQLATDEGHNYPLAAAIVKNGMYVDDVLTGHDDWNTLKESCQQLNNLLKSGGMQLRKWASNEPQLLSEFSPELLAKGEEQLIDDDTTVKTLGLIWNTKKDIFQFKVPELEPRPNFTKRIVASEMAQIFDPLGLLGPVVMYAKLFIQGLWIKTNFWDTDLDPDDHQWWSKYRQLLSSLKCLDVPRQVVYEYPSIHCFVDASKRGYGCCVYVVSTNKRGKRVSHLLTAKSRVGPTKGQTIPRLELCAALLGSKLVAHLRQFTSITGPVTFWSDAMIVLHWIRSSNQTWKPFVTNRVTEIQKLTGGCDWKHIPTKENPADLISRGLWPDKLMKKGLWWYGPEILINSTNPNNTNIVLTEEEQIQLEEERRSVAALTATEEEQLFTKFVTTQSTLFALKRKMAWIIRFTKNCRLDKEKRYLKRLTADELENALLVLVKSTQDQFFSNEIRYLQQNNQIPSKDRGFKSQMKTLNPFIDESGLVRISGRLQNAALPFDTKCPIILPYNSHLTLLMMRETHRKALHAGPQLLLAILRQKYWPIKGKILAKRIVNECIICFRNKPTTGQQLMGQLPSVRTDQAEPFSNSGVDYCGPFWVRPPNKGRGNSIKIFVAIFICMWSKAVHIETVHGLTSEAFINALKRMMARRGRIKELYCDNGRNFVGANTLLKEVNDQLKKMTTEPSMLDYLAEAGINFHFNPARSPHFGGLWEAAVKSFKYHLYRIMKDTVLPIDDFQTLSTQIESILNSRPLIPLSNDPDDISALTPGHLINGRPAFSLIEPMYTNLPTNRLSSFQKISQRGQHFWNCWSREYLSLLQQRYKWSKEQHNLQPGVLVLLKDDLAPPLRWKLGRVETIYPGKDGLVRAIQVRTSGGSYRRAVTEFAPFILTPSSFPRKEFEKAVALQTTLNELMHSVAHDEEFLRDTLKYTIKVDAFTGSLFEIYETVLKEGISQPCSLALLRSDYLANFLESNAIKQVEINTIASSFGGISTFMTPMHSYILKELGQMNKLVNLPENRALSGLCDAMVEAWKIQDRPKAVILFVIEDVTYNICDQRFHEFYIRETYPFVQVIRRTLTQIFNGGKLGPDGELLIDGQEVTVIYFRAGYEPGHYYGPNEWSARLLMERSKAIKCPSIQYHLAGTKKVQQALAKPGILKRFIADDHKIDTIKEIFTGLYPLDKNEEGDEAVRRALENPERYVLKPQREGGGNNVYGEDIPGALEKMADDERSAWILMERIFPPLSQGYMVRPGGKMPPEIVNLVSELGIFGAIIGTKDKVVYNKQVGHMLRTKLSSANEGGVAAGLGALDSPYLID